jgi:hypothetical protein
MYLIPRHLRAEKNIFDAVVVARGPLLGTYRGTTANR